jgi:hypothetical protein
MTKTSASSTPSVLATVTPLTAASLSGHPVVDQHTPARRTVQRLRNTLRLNALTSFVGGLLAAVPSGLTDRILGTGYPGWVRVVGLGLVVFAMSVVTIASARVSKLVRWTRLIVGADAAWVVVSGVTIIAGWYSRNGTVVVAFVAGMVGSFALRQHLSLRGVSQYPRESLADIDEAPSIEVAHVERTMHGSVDQAWKVITDHDLYGRLAPNLGSVHSTAPNGPGLERTCTNRNGDAWHETCTLWNEAPDSEHRFDVNVDTTNYPYPLTLMQGSWWVRPISADRVVVGMDFRYQAQRGARGRIFSVVMQAGFPLVLRRILRGWKRAIASGS